MRNLWYSIPDYDAGGWEGIAAVGGGTGSILNCDLL